jgi:uncharacterized protein (UPF0548 family)
MFFVRRPSHEAIGRFVRDSQELPLSYGPIGIVNGDIPGLDLEEVIVTIGRGRTDFDRARAALIAWKHFDIGWVDTFPRHAPVDVGTVVAVLIQHLGFWSLNSCRVLYTVRGDGHFGFAYGTLTNHAESGEELFEVLLDPASDDVKYRIRASFKPRAALTRIGQPIVRVLQARFRRDSAAAMKRAIDADGDAPEPRLRNH